MCWHRRELLLTQDKLSMQALVLPVEESICYYLINMTPQNNIYTTEGRVVICKKGKH
jgi:hypothetical protein